MSINLDRQTPLGFRISKMFNEFVSYPLLELMTLQEMRNILPNVAQDSHSNGWVELLHGIVQNIRRPMLRLQDKTDNKTSNQQTWRAVKTVMIMQIALVLFEKQIVLI